MTKAEKDSDEKKRLTPEVGEATKENLRRLSAKALIDFALRVQALAVVDGLTGLFTKGFFEEEVARRLARRGSSGALLVVDIDCFKKVNDEYGHQTGDLVLLEIANQIKSVIRPTDLAGRFGGDEFLVFFPGVSFRTAWMRAINLLEKIESATNKNERTPYVTVSIGIAVGGVEGNPRYAGLFEKADSELFDAKERGRRQISPAYSVEVCTNKNGG